MSGDSNLSPSNKAFSPSRNLNNSIERGSQDSEELIEEEAHVLEIDGDDIENDSEEELESNDGEQELELNDGEQDLELNDGEQVLELNGVEQGLEILEEEEEEIVRDGSVGTDVQNGTSDVKEYPPPFVGMEFDTYDDAYNYYNTYSKELGFAIRVKSSWTKRNSKEKRGAVLCCNCEGFKTIKEAGSRRKETRTGCLAMIRLRLVDFNRWRVDEVKLEHNHSFDPLRAKNSKSHKKMDAGAKHKVEPNLDVEVRTIKLYRTPVIDTVGHGSSYSCERETGFDRAKRLKLNKGDAQVMHDFFNQMQLIDPNFLYLMDLGDEGYLKNSIHEKVTVLQESEAFLTLLDSTVYDILRVEEFEMAWEEIMHRFGVKDQEWLQALYEARERWAPVYSKDTFFAGQNGFHRGNAKNLFFDGNVLQQTSLKEFLSTYESFLQQKKQKEVLDDLESRDSSAMLKTSSYYELQLSKLYTKAIFTKFQDEVVTMSSCLGVTQVHANGPVVTYLVKERDGDGDLEDVRHFEVMYDKAGTEVRCICSCFNFKGYLCRHALCVLNYNRVEEIPFQYILSRWRKDFKRLYVPEFGSDNIDVSNPVQWFDHLYRKAIQVVEEGMISQDHYMVAWQAFKESLNKVRLVADKRNNHFNE
ncbi:hypothetical protein NL676_026734 [Syzygium grande]|nr:hypothetical protein NL676_026734 [Syzygium grande]